MNGLTLGAIERAADRREAEALVERQMRDQVAAKGRARFKENPLGLTGIESAMGRLRAADAALGKSLDELVGRLQYVLNPENVGEGKASGPMGGVSPLQADIEDVTLSIERKAAGIDALLRRLAL